MWIFKLKVGMFDEKLEFGIGSVVNRLQKQGKKIP